MTYHVNRKAAIAALYEAAATLSAVARAARATVPPPVREEGRDLDLNIRFNHVSMHLAVLESEAGACAAYRAKIASEGQSDFGEDNRSYGWWHEYLTAAVNGLRDASFAADEAVAIAARIAGRPAPQYDAIRVAGLEEARRVAEKAANEAAKELALARAASEGVQLPAQLAAKLTRVEQAAASAAEAVKAARADAERAASEVASGIGWLPQYEGGEYWSAAFARERDAIINAAFAADDARTVGARLACEIEDMLQD